MKRQIGILTAALCTGLCVTVLSTEGQPVVRAKEQNTEQREASQMRKPASDGNVVYWDSGEKAGIYASDFLFLYGKLSAVSGEIFDPAAYSPEPVEPAVKEEEQPEMAVKEEEQPEMAEKGEEEQPETTAKEEEPAEVEPTEAVELPESVDEETAEPEFEESSAPEISRLSESSVSGNDCTGDGEPNGTDETGKTNEDEEGEDL